LTKSATEFVDSVSGGKKLLLNGYMHTKKAAAHVAAVPAAAVERI